MGNAAYKRTYLFCSGGETDEQGLPKDLAVYGATAFEDDPYPGMVLFTLSAHGTARSKPFVLLGGPLPAAWNELEARLTAIHPGMHLVVR